MDMSADMGQINQMTHNFYQLFGISEKASQIEIENAFKLLSENENTIESEIENAKIAFEILIDGSKRGIYDAWLLKSINHGIGFLNTNYKGIADDIQSAMRIEQIKHHQQKIKEQVLISCFLLFFGLILAFISIATSFSTLYSALIWTASFFALFSGIYIIIRTRGHRANFNTMLNNLRTGE